MPVLSEKVVNAELEVGRNPVTVVKFHWSSGFNVATFMVGEKIIFQDFNPWGAKFRRQWTVQIQAPTPHTITVIKTRPFGFSGILDQQFNFEIDGVPVNARQTSEINNAHFRVWDIFRRRYRIDLSGDST